MLTNAKVFKYFRYQVKQWNGLHDYSEEENLAKKKAMKWEKKITKTLVIVLVPFIAFYLPACIFIYMYITNIFLYQNTMEIVISFYTCIFEWDNIRIFCNVAYKTWG